MMGASPVRFVATGGGEDFFRWKGETLETA